MAVAPCSLVGSLFPYKEDEVGHRQNGKGKMALSIFSCKDKETDEPGD